MFRAAAGAEVEGGDAGSGPQTKTPTKKQKKTHKKQNPARIDRTHSPVSAAFSALSAWFVWRTMAITTSAEVAPDKPLTNQITQFMGCSLVSFPAQKPTDASFASHTSCKNIF